MLRPVTISLACSLLFACTPKAPGGDTGSSSDDTGSAAGSDTSGEPTPTTTAASGDTGGTVSTGGTEDTGDPTAPPTDEPDMDSDGFPDAIDLCPSIASDNNSADSDKDGIGNACDLCPRPPQQYNQHAGDANAPTFMQVRNIPAQADFDRDGIGDVCDNCVVVGNCGEFGDGPGQTPAGIGDMTPFDDASVCQVDDDELPYLGDACIDPVTLLPVQLPDSAGPAGFLGDDDLDQDGLANLVDRCPRIRVAPVSCEGDEQCDGATCSDGLCNHPDRDNDGIGDACDTCPVTANPKQALDGGVQEDDPDGDFVGSPCETHPACITVADPRPIGFNTLAVDGECCVQLFDADDPPQDPAVDLSGEDCDFIDPALPLLVDCPPEQENTTCRQLPKSVLERPGVVTLPIGCAAAGEPLTLASPGVDQDMDKLYAFACRMPSRDSDFDGIGDACDVCPQAFDPDNTDTFCTGIYAPGDDDPACP